MRSLLLVGSFPGRRTDDKAIPKLTMALSSSLGTLQLL